LLGRDGHGHLVRRPLTRENREHDRNHLQAVRKGSRCEAQPWRVSDARADRQEPVWIAPKLPRIPPKAKENPEAPQIGGTPLHAKIVQLQDEVLRLTKELRQTHRENNTAEIIRNVVGTVTTAPRGTIHWLGDTTRPRGKPTPEVPILGWADIHAGEVVEPSEVHGFNVYNMAIGEERFTRAVDKGIELSREHHTGFYPGIVANCVGDMVSGGLHPELLKTDEIESIPACIKVIDWIISAIERLKGSSPMSTCRWSAAITAAPRRSRSSNGITRRTGTT
jgi:hypothetical protein